MSSPMIRNNICLNAHPKGCAALVESWIARAKNAQPLLDLSGRTAWNPPPKAVLVLGGSTGYGLASRVVSGFGYRAATVCVSFEREPSDRKVGSPGWYDNAAFDRTAAREGVFAASLNLDAFADATRDAVVALAQGKGLEFDLVVYSLASPVRTDPKTGVMYRSAIKPIGAPYSGKHVDVFSGGFSVASAEPATAEEEAGAVKVMGGEDWSLWIDALAKGGVLARGARTVAFSYIGPEHSHAIYRNGTIGRAKEHLEATAKELDRKLAATGGRAWVSVNKALVTRASAVIPVIPLYVSTLYKVMKEKDVHEDCLDQALRLFKDRLAANPVPVDSAGRIRLDELEMRADVQAEVARRLEAVDASNVAALADLEGFKLDFLQAHGFAVPGVDYEGEPDPREI